MRTFILKPGLVIIRNEQNFKFMRYNLRGQIIFQDEQGETWCVTEKNFLQLYNKREVQIDDKQNYLGITPFRNVASPDLSFYPKAHADEAMRRKEYLNVLRDNREKLPSDGKLYEAIKIAHMQMNDKKNIPSVSSIRRWDSALRTSGCTLGLIPAHGSKGRNRVIDGEVEDIVEEIIREILLQRENIPITHAVNALGVRIEEINKYRDSSRHLCIPSKSSIYRYIKRLDPETVYKKRKGKYAAAREFRTATGTVSAGNINNRWEIDHTPVDLLLVDDETGEVIGRPWLTVVLDRESRMIMGFILHLLPPSLETVLRVIEFAIRPKAEVLAENSLLQSEWPCYGMPLRIVPDNAAEFHANNLIQGFAELNIEVLFPPSRSPKHKGSVERFFRTLAKDFIHALPGTTFSNTAERGDYPSEERACFTLASLENEMLRWIVDIYHLKKHRALSGKSPLEHWKSLQISRSLHLPADLDDLEAMLSRRSERTVHHYGVEINGIKYNSDELQRIVRRAGCPDRIEVRYRDELGHVWIKDLEDEEFLKVPAVDKRYVGLSRDIFDAARKKVKASVSTSDSWERIMRAYKKIRESVQDEKKSKKMRSRRNAAAISLDRSGKARPEQQEAKDYKEDFGVAIDIPDSEIPNFKIIPVE